MPLDTHEINLREEHQRLTEDVEDLGEEAAQYDVDTPHFDQAEATADQLNNYRIGLRWALDEWDVDTVTLKTLSSGEYARMQKHIPSDATKQARRNTLVGIATVEAPYVAADVTETIQGLADDCHPYFVGWAESRVTEFLHGDEGNSNPFYDSLEESVSQ